MNLAVCLAACLVAPFVGACSGHGPTRVCAGQCGPPYELLVEFHAGATSAQVVGVARDCATQPGVIRFGKPQHDAGGWHLTVYTTEISRSATTQPLLDCLHRHPAVGHAAWPD
jgi:hypothetical protein